MARIAALAFGGVCYAIFFATFLYLIGFLANAVVPITIDGAPGLSTAGALAVNLALIAVFGIQHSVMARPGFKAWWTRFVPQPIERSVYVLASSLALILLFVAWQPIPATLWDAEGATRTTLWVLYGVGVVTVLYATFLIDHFDLFGLRQVVIHFLKREYSDRPFHTPSLYRFVRHPLYVGWFITMWATPSMSVGHLVFALGMSAYILAAIPFEERDLIAALGEPYRRYAARTPRFLPRLRSVRKPGLQTT